MPHFTRDETRRAALSHLQKCKILFGSAPCKPLLKPGGASLLFYVKRYSSEQSESHTVEISYKGAILIARSGYCQPPQNG